MPQKTAKLFKTGGSQAVRLPAEFRFPGSEVRIRRDERTGEVILMEATPTVDSDLRERDRLEALARLRAARDSMTDEDRRELAKHPFERPLNTMGERRNPFDDDGRS